MASTLRRRVLGNETPSDSSSPAPTPRDESPEKQGGDAKVVTAKVIHHQVKTKKRRTTLIFLLGSIFGIIAAGFFAKSNDLIDFPEIGELSMDSFFDVLPAGLVRDMRDLIVCAAAGSGPCRPFDHVANRLSNRKGSESS